MVRANNELSIRGGNAGRGLPGFGGGLTVVALLLAAAGAALGCGEAEDSPCEGSECPPVPVRCELNGTTYGLGSRRPAGDGCNTCSCSERGWLCTAMACNTGCVYDGRVFSDRSRFAANDGCNQCSCSAGQVACTNRDCTVTETCSFGGARLTEGEVRLAGDGCNQCTCSSGEMLCTQRACTPRCYDNASCGDTQYCSFPDGTCLDPGPASSGSDAETEELRAPPNGAQPVPPDGTGLLPPGVCRDRPTQCSGDDEQVCGCDGVTYRTACAAASLGLNLLATGPCPQNP